MRWPLWRIQLKLLAIKVSNCLAAVRRLKEGTVGQPNPIISAITSSKLLSYAKLVYFKSQHLSPLLLVQVEYFELNNRCAYRLCLQYRWETQNKEWGEIVVVSEICPNYYSFNLALPLQVDSKLTSKFKFKWLSSRRKLQSGRLFSIITCRSFGYWCRNYTWGRRNGQIWNKLYKIAGSKKSEVAERWRGFLPFPPQFQIKVIQ